MRFPRRRDQPYRAAALAVAVLLAVLPAGAVATGRNGGGTAGNLEPGTSGVPRVGALGVTLTANPEAGYTSLNVRFQANVTGAGPTGLTVHWTFGDGTSGSGGLNVTHVYNSAGRFVATVSIEDTAGDWGNASLAVFAVAPPGPAPGLDPAQSLGVLVAGAGIGVLAAFGTYLALGRRRPTDAGDLPPDTPTDDPTPSENAPSFSEDLPGGSATEPAASPVPPSDRSGTTVEATSLAARRRVSDEVLLLLGSLGRPSPDEVADPTRTQGGMSEKLGLAQNVVSPVLRRLTAAGVVAVEVRHVRNGRRRLKVYRLTDRGEAVVRDLRSRR